MNDFDSIENFHNHKEGKSQHGLFGNQVFSGKSDMKYLSKREREDIELIPDEALIAIKNFESFNPKMQTMAAGYHELEVCVPIWSHHMEQTLLYALTSGTAYTIENGNIYIWYRPFKGLDGSGFYKLKRFVFFERTVKYFLDGDEKLSNPF